MVFFGYVACLGLGYFIGKRYCFDYRMTHPHDVPNCSEFSFRVKESENQEQWFRNHCWHHRYATPPKQYSPGQGEANSFPTHKMESN